MNNISFHDYYYLVYKLKSNPTLWIVDESIHKEDLTGKIKNISSKEEIYYVISKKYASNLIEKKLESKFKRFRIFKIDKYCKLIYKTQ